MMFIYSGIVVIWDPWILICHPPVTLSRGKSQFTELKGEQCPQNEDYCYIKACWDCAINHASPF